VTLAYVALGANLGNPRRQIELALEALAMLPKTSLRRHSSLYRSAPVGYAEQPDFVNAVAELETGLSPLSLWRELQAIEARQGRRRSFPNAPRTLDLDLLLYGEAPVQAPGLTIPHMRMHERAFVLVPLAEIAPEAEVPGRGAVRELLAGCQDQVLEKLP